MYSYGIPKAIPVFAKLAHSHIYNHNPAKNPCQDISQISFAMMANNASQPSFC
jgi:hypothetical protein